MCLLADLFRRRAHLLVDLSGSARESQFQRRQTVLVCQHGRGAVLLDCLLLLVQQEFVPVLSQCARRQQWTLHVKLVESES